MVKVYHRSPYVNRRMHDLFSENSDLLGLLMSEEFNEPVAEVQSRNPEQSVLKVCFVLLIWSCSTSMLSELATGLLRSLSADYVFGMKAITEALRRRSIDHPYNVVITPLWYEREVTRNHD